MKLFEKAFSIPADYNLEAISSHIKEALKPEELPIRFIITDNSKDEFKCEVGVCSPVDLKKVSIFDFWKRKWKVSSAFTTVLLIPTGIGASIGGHAGDANPVAKLLASVSDTLVTHPNVVNASDINELPENGLYVEGSVISRLMMGQIGLRRVRSNRILMVVGSHKEQRFVDDVINAVSAARSSFGIDCDVSRMKIPLDVRIGYNKSGRAAGEVDGIESLFALISKHKANYDAVGLTTEIKVSNLIHEAYFQEREAEVVNPWGGVEALLTHALAEWFEFPFAHSPMMESTEVEQMHFGVTDPRKAAEVLSKTWLYCILKGLHKAPKIVCDPLCRPDMVTIESVSCLVIPDKCIGLPVLAAAEHGIPVIAVKDNYNIMTNNLDRVPFQKGKFFRVKNYFEAAGLILALKKGIEPAALTRPFCQTKIV